EAAHAHHEVGEEVGKLHEGFDVLFEHVLEKGKEVIEKAAEWILAYQAFFEFEKVVDNVFETAETTEKLNQQAQMLGVNVEQLQEYGNAVKRFGGTAEEFGNSLRNMEYRLERVSLAAASGKKGSGGPGGRFFAALGITAEDA